MKKSLFYGTSAVALVSLSTPAQAGDAEIEYRLPKTTIGFAVSHTITSCPDANNPAARFDMKVNTAVAPVSGAGATVLVNVKGGLFVDRDVKIEYHKDGIIKSFNASSKGQGGPLLASALKAGAFVGGLATGTGLPVAAAVAAGDAGGPVAPAAVPPPPLECQPWVIEALATRAGLVNKLADLQSLSIMTAPTVKRLESVALLSGSITAIDKRLTVTGERALWVPSKVAASFDKDLNAGELRVWFTQFGIDAAGKTALKNELSKAGYGQALTFKATGRVAGKVTDAAAPPTKAMRALYYYTKPASAKASIKPKDAFDAGSATKGAAALALLRYQNASNKASTKVPQLGVLRNLPFDGSGLFGSRGVSASFSESGELASIGFSSAGGSEALASTVDAAVASGADLRDARLNNLNREIELLTAENELRELLKGDVAETSN